MSLVGGDLISHGILYATQEFDNGPVCAEDFDQVDAGKILFSPCSLMLDNNWAAHAILILLRNEFEFKGLHVNLARDPKYS